MSEKTIDDQIKSVVREIGMRQRCYPAWVKKGTMTQEQASHELACMESIHRTLTKVRNEQESVGRPRYDAKISKVLNDIGSWDCKGEALREAVDSVYGVGTWELVCSAAQQKPVSAT